MSQMLFAFQRLLISHSHDQVSWRLSNSSVHEDCWGERDKIQTKPRKKGIAAAIRSVWLGIQAQPFEPKTHLFSGDRGPHSRAACSPWWNQDEWHLLTGIFWQGGWALVSLALVGGSAYDVIVPDSFPCRRGQSFLPLSSLI